MILLIRGLWGSILQSISDSLAPEHVLQLWRQGVVSDGEFPANGTAVSSTWSLGTGTHGKKAQML